MIRPRPNGNEPGYLLRLRFVAAARARLVLFVAAAVRRRACGLARAVAWRFVSFTVAAAAAVLVAGAPAARGGESGSDAAALEKRPLPASWQEAPVRAAWIVRDALVTEKLARQSIRDVAEAGMRVAFVQVVGRADAYYDSDYLPRGEAIREGGGYDPLAVVLDEAAKCGVEVHAWVNVFLVWSGTRAPRSPAHVVRKHPEWTIAGADLKSYARLSQKTLERRGVEGVYLSPSQPGVHEHVRRFVSEILEKYEVAGIHLDYVRYPHPDAGYDRASREGFERRSGIDPAQIVRNERGLKARLGREKFALLVDAWRDYKADQVTELVREIGADVRELRPGAMLSAAVRPNPDDAKTFYGQDWIAWLDEGTLEAAAPMCYVKKTGEFAQIVRKICDRADGGRVLAGVSVYNQGASAAAEKIKAADACGMLGTSIFSWNSIAEDRGYVRAVRVAMAERTREPVRETAAAGVDADSLGRAADVVPAGEPEAAPAAEPGQVAP